MTDAIPATAAVETGSPTAFDAAIIGANAAGSLLALLLARRSKSVLLLDRTAGIGMGDRQGELLLPAAVQMLQLEGLLQAVLDAGAVPLRKVRFLTPEGRVMHVLDFGGLDGSHPYALAIEHRDLQRVLLQQASGLEMGWSLEPRSVKAGEGWTIEARLGRSWKTRLLVGTERRSTVRDALRVAATRRSYRDRYVTAQVARPAQYPADTVEIYLARGHALWLVPLPADRLLVRYSLHPEEVGEIRVPWLKEAVIPMAPHWDGPLGEIGPDALRAVSVPARSEVACLWGPGAVLLGDAAYDVHAAAGGSLSLSLLDAWDLARILDGTPMPLQAFEASRRPWIRFLADWSETAAWIMHAAGPRREKIWRRLSASPALALREVEQAALMTRQPWTWRERLQLLAMA